MAVQKPLSDNFSSVYQAWKAGKFRAVEAAECRMSRSTFRYKAQRYGGVAEKGAKKYT